jgi:ABC-type sugar transport system ATPase subunit
MPAIRIETLSKKYSNGTVGLKPCTFEIHSEECLVLTGPSGSGKSTLLRLIAGLEKASTGKIFFDGQEVQNLPPHQRQLAYLAQKPALFPHLNVRENLSVGREFEEKRKPRVERLSNVKIQGIVEEKANSLQIADLLQRRVHELSGGEQQRVALGRALVRGVKLWLLDEPISQLDFPLRQKLSADIHLLKRSEGITIVYVTHDPLEAKALADRLGVLEENSLRKIVSPEEILVSSGQPSVFFRF